MWGFVFLFLFFGGHRPVIDFVSSKLDVDISGHWWGGDELIKSKEVKIKVIEQANLVGDDGPTGSSVKSDGRLKQIRELQDEINKIRADKIPINIYIYSFARPNQFSLIRFRQFRKISGGSRNEVESREEYNYTIRGNKIIYWEKRKTAAKPEPIVEKFWYYKVSGDGKQLLLSISPDFLEPIILKNRPASFRKKPRFLGIKQTKPACPYAQVSLRHTSPFKQSTRSALTRASMRDPA